MASALHRVARRRVLTLAVRAFNGLPGMDLVKSLVFIDRQKFRINETNYIKW